MDQLREKAAWENTAEITLFGRKVSRRKLLNLEWGAQLTVNFIASSRPEVALIILDTMRQAGTREGSSILFGLDGETQETIEEMIDKVEELLAEDLISIASPNILTYHPNTEISHLHQKEIQLDYHSANLENRPPYTYFEEAFPAVVSKNLSEEQIWHIHEQTRERWGKKRNLNPMAPATLPVLEGTLAASSS